MSKKTNSSSSDNSSLPLVIVNPRSAAGSTREKWVSMVSDFRTHFGAFSVAFTKKPGDGIELARRGVENGRTFIIACGGDGTINEIANAILASGVDVELGILPSGTGGDFRRSIGMPSGIRDAARALRTGETKRIDVGRVTFQNFNDETIDRYFLNVSSFGLAASIIQRVKSSGSLSWLPHDLIRGKASFALSTLQEVVGLDFVTVRVKIDDKKESTLNTINFCIANARYFGGGMKIAPDAKLDDGEFDVVNIGDIGTARILLNGYTLYRGTHLDLNEVKSTRAVRVEISPQTPGQEIHLELDGELPGKLPALYEIVPNALSLRVPPKQTD